MIELWAALVGLFFLLCYVHWRTHQRISQMDLRIAINRSENEYALWQSIDGIGLHCDRAMDLCEARCIHRHERRPGPLPVQQ